MEKLVNDGFYQKDPRADIGSTVSNSPITNKRRLSLSADDSCLTTAVSSSSNSFENTLMSKAGCKNFKKVKTARRDVARNCDSSLDFEKRRPKKRPSNECRNGSQPATVSDTTEWEIVKIVDQRLLKGKARNAMEYKVRWKSTWVLEEDVNAPELIRQFKKNKGM